MSQSERHRKLLLSLVEWIHKYFDNLGDKYSICVDHLADNRMPHPPVIVSSIPDAFARSLSSSHIIIGEAETSKGLLGKQTDRQIEDFIKYCLGNKEALFVLAVPWDMVIRAKAIIKQTKRELDAENVQTIVLEGLEA